jgi:peptide/nickel transport system substrate-binding protein
MAARRGAPPGLAAAAGLVLTLALLAGCARGSSPPPPPHDTLVVALESAPGHLDPRLGTDAASDYVRELWLRGLVTKEPDGTLVPDLARSWEVLEEGRRWRFHLAPGQTFHDGRPLAAADVAWTFGSIVDSTVPTSKRGSFAPLAAVVAVDETTVDFVLSEPWGSLLVNLTPGTGVVPRGVLPAELERDLVGSGPYRIASRDADSVTLVAWEAFPGGPPPMERIVLRAVPDATVRALELEKGSVQLVVNGLAPDVVPLFRRRAGFAVVQTPGANYAYLGFNLEDPVLGRRDVRQALARAIDRAAIVASLYRGQGRPTETLLPPGHWARHDGLPAIPHDPAAARRMLDEAGLPDPDGAGPRPRFALVYSTSTNEPSLLQAQVVQAMLAEVGVAVEIRSHEFATFYGDVKRGAFQLYSLTWTGVADPDLYRYVLHSASIPPDGANRNRYRSAEFDALVERAGRLFDPALRRPLYLRAQEVVHRDLPYLSLFTRDTVAVHLEGLEGYENYPSGELYSLPRVRWER